jgi:hypothetical protein
MNQQCITACLLSIRGEQLDARSRTWCALLEVLQTNGVIPCTAVADPATETNTCSLLLRPTSAAPPAIHFRKVGIYDAHGLKVPATSMTAAMSSEYTADWQSFQAGKCMDCDFTGKYDNGIFICAIP